MTTRKKTRQQEPEPTASQPSTMGSPEEEAQRFQVSGVWPPTLDLLDDDVAGPSSVSKLEVVTERRTDEDITAADNRRFLGELKEAIKTLSDTAAALTRLRPPEAPEKSAASINIATPAVATLYPDTKSKRRGQSFSFVKTGRT